MVMTQYAILLTVSLLQMDLWSKIDVSVLLYYSVTGTAQLVIFIQRLKMRILLVICIGALGRYFSKYAASLKTILLGYLETDRNAQCATYQLIIEV